ncbi:hypothetical protein [Spiroplasma clarkii]|nr:hypothetical protein [Spiroplasma clarkii]
MNKTSKIKKIDSYSTIVFPTLASIMLILLGVYMSFGTSWNLKNSDLFIALVIIVPMTLIFVAFLIISIYLAKKNHLIFTSNLNQKFNVRKYLTISIIVGIAALFIPIFTILIANAFRYGFSGQSINWWDLVLYLMLIAAVCVPITGFLIGYFYILYSISKKPANKKITSKMSL